MTSSWPPAFAAAVHAALQRRLPPAANSAALEQLSQDLVDALESGQLSLPLTSEREDLARSSGWLEGESSPLLIQADRIGWRRWLEAMQCVVDQLLARRLPDRPAAEPASPDRQPECQPACSGAGHGSLACGPAQWWPWNRKTSTVVELLQRVCQRHPGLRIGSAPVKLPAGWVMCGPSS